MSRPFSENYRISILETSQDEPQMGTTFNGQIETMGKEVARNY